jgi:hypothetical protein
MNGAAGLRRGERTGRLLVQAGWRRASGPGARGSEHGVAGGVTEAPQLSQTSRHATVGARTPARRARAMGGQKPVGIAGIAKEAPGWLAQPPGNRTGEAAPQGAQPSRR